MRWLFAGCLLWLGWESPAAEKAIRLRNQVIATPTKTAGAPGLTAAVPASGLYLVQFEDRFDPAWQPSLQGLGVEVIGYVPEDTCLARFNQVSVAKLRALPQVRWVGEYRPEHKVHSGLRPAGLALAPAGAQDIRLLISPLATAREVRLLWPLMTAVTRRTSTRLGVILQGRATPEQVDALSRAEAVLWIERAPRPRLFDEVATKIVAGDDLVTGTRAQVHQLGFDGTGVTVAVADSGLNNGDAATMHPDLAGRTPTFYYYGNLLDAADEHSHGTHVAGIIAGNAATGEADENGALYGLGVAPGARIVTQRMFDGAGGYEPPASNEILTRDAVRAGAEIGSNSWGDDTQGRYDLSAAEFDGLVRDADALTAGDQPYILEFSAGNAGPGYQTIGSPAVGKNVIATGAAQSSRADFFIYTDGPETMADFSSRGPCEDGRIKPDIVAPGTWISSLLSGSSTDENAWGSISANYIYMGGTSQAGPHASGAAAVFVQYYRATHTNQTPSPALVKAALINSAVDMDNTVETDAAPNMDEGWGRIDLTQIIGADRKFDYVDQTTNLTVGKTYERRLIFQGGAPLKVTLAYTDVPALPAAIPALVNDLDLQVVAPDGTIYHGNQFDEEGESVPNAPAYDRLNNVEGVKLSAPTPGEYIIRVMAYNVAQDARRDTAAADQDFALVTSGAAPIPGVGAVFLDRRLYTAPGLIRLQLYDTDLARQATATVVVRSSVETNGETIILQASGSSGLFTGAVATAVGTAPVADGQLQLMHGSTIEAVYLDNGQTRMATARADLVAPQITEVAVTNQFGKMVISWTTDEPADSVVRFSTNTAYASAVTNSVLLADHAVALADLKVGTTYHFYVVSSDEAGNTRTNNNGGAGFTFVATPPAAVLLVNSYAYDSDSVEIPLSAYTNSLRQLGITFEVWDAIARGAPQFNDLRPFQVVIWRINDSFYMALDSSSTLSAQNQSTITNYLAHGGAFFMSSMEILSRMGDCAFRTNVFQMRSHVGNPNLFGPCQDCDEDHGVPEAQGIAGDVISSGMWLVPDYSDYPSEEFLELGPDLADTFTATTNAAVIFKEPILDHPTGSAAGYDVGIRYPRTGQDSTGRVVFLSFPIDAVPESATAPNNRVNLFRNILGFLAPGINGLGTISLDSGRYTIPSQVTVEVGDADLAGLGTATVKFYSRMDSNGVAITLAETPRSGLFRGFITLAATNAAANGKKLRTYHGETIRAEYFDVSGNVVMQAAAVVDTQVPGISGVTAEPDYEDIVVYWDTTEETDALVQYGESPSALGMSRTAYDSALDTYHELLLPGLQPDRTYYFQVVSRDAAGNTVVDDNGGHYYQATTFKPIIAPYNSGFPSLTNAWTTYEGEDSQARWTLGVPDNGMETAAASPPYAWGSNLKGANIDYADAFLLSPAIQLTGGTRATLRFATSYDFTDVTGFDILEGGLLYIFTNRTAQPITLAEFGDTSGGWYEEEIDLTPYLGHVVYLVWHHQLLSLESASRAGWLVDDVAITLSSAPTGTLAISNNLSQATYVLSGALSLSGQGNWLLVTNAPAGDYSVTFADVPYYLKPATQSGTLTAGGTLRLAGAYTMLDANQNGIADTWEQQYFGSATNGHLASLDSDRDGMSDLAEFIAGTNPTNALSLLRVTPPAATNRQVRLNWDTVPGRGYRILGSTDLTNWFTVVDWFRASNTLYAPVLSLSNQPPAMSLRLEVRP